MTFITKIIFNKYVYLFQQTFPGFGDGGFHMSFGIGAFPFGIFASSFNFGDTRPAPGYSNFIFASH